MRKPSLTRKRLGALARCIRMHAGRVNSEPEGQDPGPRLATLQDAQEALRWVEEMERWMDATRARA